MLQAPLHRHPADIILLSFFEGPCTNGRGGPSALLNVRESIEVLV